MILACVSGQSVAANIDRHPSQIYVIPDIFLTKSEEEATSANILKCKLPKDLTESFIYKTKEIRPQTVPGVPPYSYMQMVTGKAF